MSTSASAEAARTKDPLRSSTPRLGDIENSDTVTPLPNDMSVDATIVGPSSSPGLPRDSMQGQTGRKQTEGMLGQTLGTYELIGVLGEGGMGRVYLAEHTKIGRQVALKMLHTHLARSPDVVRRFFDEARAVNQILHENIVEITDFIENDDGNNYFIMEYLRGTALSHVLDQGREDFTLARALDIGIQVASALGAVHKANIVHRDLKPENVFLTERGGRKDFVKLLDFGIAKLVGDVDNGIKLKETEAGVIMGTPDYMSPQQACATPVDSRTDIYSFGVILYEMCTGRLPYKAKDFGDLIVMHKTKSPVAPNQVPDLPQKIPAALNDLILRCLEKEPEDRPANCDVIEEQLRSIRSEDADAVARFNLEPSASQKNGARSKGMMITAGLVVLASCTLLLASTLGAFGREDQSASRKAPKPENTVSEVLPAAPETTPNAKPDEPKPERVQLTFQTQPSGAQVYSMGTPQTLLGVTPFDVSLDRKDEEVGFEIRKEGFEVATQQIRLDRSNRLQVSLEPIVSELAPSKTASKQRKNTEDKVVKKVDDKPASTGSQEQAVDPEKTTNPEADPSKKMYKEGAVMNPFGKK